VAERPQGVPVEMEGEEVELLHGSVVIAAITSCTNTSNPSVMIAAGLLAKNAVERGDMTNYIQDDGSVANYPLSPAESMQLWRLAADDIDFSTPCPAHTGCGTAPNGLPGVAPLSKAGDPDMWSAVGVVASQAASREADTTARARWVPQLPRMLTKHLRSLK